MKCYGLQRHQHVLAGLRTHWFKNRLFAITGRRCQRRKNSDPDSYKSWKRKLPFWPRKGLILFELMVVISIGVLIGQMREVSGMVKMFIER